MGSDRITETTNESSSPAAASADAPSPAAAAAVPSAAAVPVPTLSVLVAGSDGDDRNRSNTAQIPVSGAASVPGSVAVASGKEQPIPADESENYGFNRIRYAFKKAAEEKRLAFIAYMTNGYPKLGMSSQILLTLEKSGCDVVEVGIPFSDPVVDGATIQTASEMALAEGATLKTAFLSVKQARDQGLSIGIVFMTYWNPVLAYGVAKACEDAVTYGVDGFLVVDLPIDVAVLPLPSFAYKTPVSVSGDVQIEFDVNKSGSEIDIRPSFVDLCKSFNLSFIPMLSPNTSVHRAKITLQAANSFIYCINLVGLTGSTGIDEWKDFAMNNLTSIIQSVKAARSQLIKSSADYDQGYIPSLASGFGISGPAHVDVLREFDGIDGFVIGSALVKHINVAAKSKAPVASRIARRLTDFVKKTFEPTAQQQQQQQQPQQQSSSSQYVYSAIASFCGPVRNAASPKSSESSSAVLSIRPSETQQEQICAPIVDVGSFGEFGGCYVAESLVNSHRVLAEQFKLAIKDPEFVEKLKYYRCNYIGGPTPIHFAKRLTEKLGGAKIYFKREDLAFTGAHKINNAIGQALLAIKLGKNRIVAETGAGQHGVATATACALFNLECFIYMGEIDMKRQKLNVARMQVLGAKVVVVRSGSKTLKDAVTEAFRDWVSNLDSTHYIIGSVVGPHPFPTIVKYFQSVIGREARTQMLEQEPRRLPDVVVACVGGGSNAIGTFSAFIDDPSVRLVGVEGGGPSLPAAEAEGAAKTEGTVESTGEPAAGVPVHVRFGGKAAAAEETLPAKVALYAGAKPETFKLETAATTKADQTWSSRLSKRSVSRELKEGSVSRAGTFEPGHYEEFARSADHAATLSKGRPGVFHGSATYLLQTTEGQIMQTNSISAGLDYPGVGPELSSLKVSGRAEFTWAVDSEALDALHLVASTEGIIVALESAHGLSWVIKHAPLMSPDKIMLATISGRGDKDMEIVAASMESSSSGNVDTQE